MAGTMFDDLPDPTGPALSVEEWIQFGADMHVLQRLAAGGRPWGFQRRLTPPQKLHAVAAMALYGQSFGFTHDDVRLLRIDLQSRTSGGWSGEPDRLYRLENLAQRIAALLPPAGVEPVPPER